MNFFKDYEYVPKWLAIVVPFIIYYWQWQAQKAKRRRGEPAPDIDWVSILLSFFTATTFAACLSSNTPNDIRTFAILVFFFA